MKITAIIILMSLLLLCATGCESANTGLSPKTDSGCNKLSAYGPVKIDIMPLTEFAGKKQLNVYVNLLDSSNCQVKTPAVFRFELYEKIPRSAEPKGKRVFFWPDIDLTDVDKNNEHWKDFLRAYEFNLPFQIESGKSYILQITAICANGRRLSDELTLK